MRTFIFSGLAMAGGVFLAGCGGSSASEVATTGAGGAAGQSGGAAGAAGSTSHGGGGQAGACVAPVSAVPTAPATTPAAGSTAVTVALHNHCSETLWPAWGRTGGLDQTTVESSFWTPLAPGGEGQTTIHYVVVLEIGVWGRTACGFDAEGHGACETGNCVGQPDGAAGFACLPEVNALPNDATIFAFDGGGYRSSFNVPMRVTSTGCAAQTCSIDLTTECPSASRVVGGCGDLVACTESCPGGAAESSCCAQLHIGCFKGGAIDVTFCP